MSGRWIACSVLLLFSVGTRADSDFMRLLEAGRIEEAEKQISSLSGSSTAKRYAQAQVSFYRQRYTEAAKLLEGMEAGGAFADEIMRVRELALVTAEKTAGFVSFESDHFIFRYRAGKDAILPLYAAEAMERARKRIGDDLGVVPPEKMVIEFYPSWRDFTAVSTLTEKEIETTGTVALCKFNRMMVTTPRALLRGYPWIDTAVHEYVHYALQRESDGRAPVWLHEGIAKYLERRWREPPESYLPEDGKVLLGRRLKKNDLISFAAMHPSIAKLKSAEDAATAFAEVYFFVKFLVEAKGSFATLQKAIQEISRGSTAEDAISNAYKTPFEVLFSEWKKWLSGQGLPLETMERAKKTVLQEDEEMEDHREVKGIESEKARDFIRLGDLLGARGRPRAALTEFEKAAAELKVPSEFLENRIALVAVGVKDFKKAREALDRAALRAPEYAVTFVRRGVLALRDGDRARAEKDFLTAVAISPFDPEIHRGLIEIYRVGGNKELVKREEKALEVVRIR